MSVVVGVGALTFSATFPKRQLLSGSLRGVQMPASDQKEFAPQDVVNRIIEDLTRFLKPKDYWRSISGPVPTALALHAAMGSEVRLVARVGTDSAGEKTLLSLPSIGAFDSGHVQKTGPSTGASLVIVDPQGHTQILTGTSKDVFVDPSRVAVDAVLGGAQMLHIDGREQPAAKLMAKRAVELGIPIIYDVGNLKPGSLDLLQYATYAQFPMRSGAGYGRFKGQTQQHDSIGSSAPPFTQEELDDMKIFGRHIQRQAQQILADYPNLELVVITHGEKGLTYCERNDTPSFGVKQPQYIPAYRVAAVDTDGTGDIFCGMLGWALAEGRETQEALELASAAAGWKAMFPGHVNPRNGLQAILDFQQTTPKYPDLSVVSDQSANQISRTIS